MQNRSIIPLFILLLFLSACQNNSDNTTITRPIIPPPLSQEDLDAYKKKGKTIAEASFNTLNEQLKIALKEGGVPNAVGYCNLSAQMLTDSLSKKYKAKIRRVSLKLRSGSNAPTPEESSFLKRYEAKLGLDKNAYLIPVVIDRKEYGVDFYAPIRIKKTCLQCHGIPGETLSDKNRNFIKNLYPNDRAIGYKEGDLRGIWSINFKR